MDRIDTIDLIEVQRESKEGANYNSRDFKTTFIMILGSAKMEIK